MEKTVSKAIKIVITGSNRGLGLELARQCALKKDLDQELILTVRDTESIPAIQADLLKLNNKIKLSFFSLELSNPTSVQDFVSCLFNEHGSVDVLVNNAGVHLEKSRTPSAEIARDIFATNYFGTVQLTESVLPILSENGKIINVSSIMDDFVARGGNEIVEVFSDPSLNKEILDSMAQDFVTEFEKTKDSQGWNFELPFVGYGASKIFLNAYTRFSLARAVESNQMAFAMSPGWCETDMGGYDAPRSAMQGVETMVYLIYEIPFERDEKLNGEFFSEENIIDFF